MARVKKETQDPVSLVEAIESADKQTATEGARAIVFESMNAAKEKPIDDRFPLIVERTFASISWNDVFDAFEAWMQLGDRRTEEGFIRKAHEEGPAMIRSVFQAYVQIKHAREKWELENDVVLGGMREEASKALQAEKDRGQRSKAITEADITKAMATMFPDEHARQESRRLQYKLVEDSAKHDVEVATIRCRHLDSMLNRLR